MRIGLDARYVYDHFPGIGRYVVHLAHALSSLTHPHTLVLFYNPTLPNTRHDIEMLRHAPAIELVETSARPFSLVEHLQIPNLARVFRLDLLHSPYYIKPYAGLPCPSIVTIYDLIGNRFPDVLPPRARHLFNLATWLAVHTSQRILTISHSARDDLVQYYGISPDRIAVTPLAADSRFTPQPPHRVTSVRETYGLPGRYVLYLGANKPHKNLERLVYAWEQICQNHPEVQLVLAGHYDPRYPQVQHIVESRGLHTSVTFLPNVSEADLPALYSGAEVFAFPSYYEGFGLPPLEAMACGTAVLCGNVSSLPEVVGDAALTVDPYSVPDLASGLNRLLAEPSLRHRLCEQGLQRAATFSWRRTAEATLVAYESIVTVQG
jgi:alpha-1,3-rhamnosyl/mannosyltransferase